MAKIRVALGDRSYNVIVGADLATKPSTWKLARTGSNRGFIFADSRLRALELRFVRALRSAGWKTEIIRLAASEQLKDFQQIYPLYGKLLKLKADRHCTIFALGGGTIGDAVGFLAGTYKRGIPWVGVPTTLLSQVDSAIGGKTGVNHSIGKNLIGVFHQPSLVVCDTNVLKSLSTRDRLSGLGEMLKYGLIYDPALWRFFKKNWQGLLDLKPSLMEKAVAACVQWKARAVAKDERDVSGVREALNFGHTVGHALEAITRYGYFRHGEAIFIGMRAAAMLSLIRSRLKITDFEEIDRFLSAFKVPRVPAFVTGRKLLDQIRFDKKARDGKVRFVLLKKIGQVVLDPSVEDQEFLAALQKIGIRS